MGQDEPEALAQEGVVSTLSVVVASNRDPARIRSCLEGLRAQDYPPDRFEVVVVDDGSPVPLAPVVDEFAGSLRTRTHRQAPAGPAVARNAGARVATGDFLAFTDDDCVPDPNWLRLLAEAMEQSPDALVGGRVVNRLSDDRFAEATHELILSLDDAYGFWSPRRFFTSNNLAVSREAFATVGGFDESFTVPGGEDRELCERWQAQGRPLVRADRAVVSHAHRMTLRSFVRQHYNYGRGAYQLRHRRDEADVPLEPLGFYARILADPFRRLPVAAATVQSALFLLTQVATAVGYVGEWRQSRR